MKSQLLLVLLVLGLVSLSLSQTVPPGCNGAQNNQPVVEEQPVLEKKVANGERYLIKNGTNFVYIMKVHGTPYEMGFAQGQLMGDEIAANVAGMYQYLIEQVSALIKKYTHLPDSIIAKIIAWGLKAFNWALDLNWTIAGPYTPARFEDEILGIADGAQGKIDYQTLRRINMLPELIQAACTIVGAWGPATKDHQLLQLRSLDWASDAPVNQFPAIVIYNSTEAGSNVFANIGFAGLVGTLTAMSKNGVGIGEKVWYPPKGMTPKPKITYFGKPWAFVLRDLAQFGKNIEQMLGTISNTDRTMRIHIGLSSLADNSFRGMDYSENVVLNFNDKNYTDYSPAHPQMDGVFYFDKHVQPSNNECVGNILKDSWPNITPSTLFRDVAGFHYTGDTQVCAMDLTNGQIWLSYSEFGSNQKAYLRSPIHVKLTDFWGPQQPSFSEPAAATAEM